MSESTLCPICRGSGSLLGAPLQWWTCPCCGGAGVRIMFGPPAIRTHARAMNRLAARGIDRQKGSNP